MNKNKKNDVSSSNLSYMAFGVTGRLLSCRKPPGAASAICQLLCQSESAHLTLKHHTLTKPFLFLLFTLASLFFTRIRVLAVHLYY